MKIKGGGKIFAVATEVDDELLKGLRQTPEILQAANAAGAAYWHEKILPGHFDKPAHGKYGYARRAKNYLLQARKKGKPDLVMSGQMRREMIHNRQITSTATGAKLKLAARVLNLVGGNNDDPNAYVTHKAKNGHTRSYPNLKREVKVVLEDEREAVAKVVATTIQAEIHPSPQSKELASLARLMPPK